MNDCDEDMKLFEFIYVKRFEYELLSQCVPEDTIQFRGKHNNLTNINCGLKSPTADLEPTLSLLLKFSSQIGIHVSQRRKCIEIANELISGTVHKHRVAPWLYRNQPYVHDIYENDEMLPEGSLGYGWVHGSRSQFPEITLQHDVNVKHYRVSWATYSNLDDMHDMVNDNEVNEFEAFGERVCHKLLYPDSIMTMDETGNVDARWTIQGWTTLSDDVVIAIIIMKKTSVMDWNEFYGFNKDAPWDDDETQFGT
eukprot:jgi/Psemu1/12591/gm1.12591_g